MASFEHPSGSCICGRDKCSYECPTYSRWNPKPQTHGDRIRAKSDEELAEWIETIANCALCQFKGKSCKGGGVESRASCNRHWLDWLREEAT